uniref:Uncharacterized protein n=1 Tax=Glossina austeni TaxID=7395 RepID=A0A1A9UU89_GLOAU
MRFLIMDTLETGYLSTLGKLRLLVFSNGIKGGNLNYAKNINTQQVKAEPFDVEEAFLKFIDYDIAYEFLGERGREMCAKRQEFYNDIEFIRETTRSLLSCFSALFWRQQSRKEEEEEAEG